MNDLPTPQSAPTSPRPRSVDGPIVQCADCAGDYLWSDSPSLERCAPCAASRAVYLDRPEDEV